MARQWIRLYTELLNDPKVQLLPSELFKAYINLLCIAGQVDNGGEIPGDYKDIAFRLHYLSDESDSVIQKLLDAGLLNMDGEKLFIHGWSVRQYQSDTDPTRYERVKRFRDKENEKIETDIERVSNAFQNGKETRIDTETDTETDKDKRETSASPSPPPPVDNSPQKPEKESHGEFGNVKLATEEYLKLTTRYGKQQVDKTIEAMGAWMKSKGKAYKDHYAALLNWIKKDGIPELQPRVWSTGAPEVPKEDIVSDEEVVAMQAKLRQRGIIA